MEQSPEWPEYLDALDLYLQQVAQMLSKKSLSTVPVLRTRQPSGPVPSEHSDRAAALLEESQRVEASIATWIEDVLASMRSISSRRRLEPYSPSGLVNSLL
jgi:hypothetical protein